MPKIEHVNPRKFALCMAGAALLACPASATATNRCVTPGGRIIYTDRSCESVNAKPHGEVRDALQVAPSAVPPARANPAPARKDAAPAFESNVRAAVFRKSPKAPTLAVCYSPKDARADAPVGEVESAIRQALSQWNEGCNINYQYAGLCPADEAAWQRSPADYRVYWTSWDNSLTISNDSEALAREHAVAMASSAIGVSLNRDVAVPAWRLQRAIVHEFGHVIGMAHSKNPGDIMFSGGMQRTPTAADHETCNRAIETRYGIKADYR